MVKDRQTNQPTNIAIAVEKEKYFWLILFGPEIVFTIDKQNQLLFMNIAKLSPNPSSNPADGLKVGINPNSSSSRPAGRPTSRPE